MRPGVVVRVSPGMVDEFACDSEGLRRVDELFGKGSVVGAIVRDQIHEDVAKRFGQLIAEAGLLSTEGWFG